METTNDFVRTYFERAASPDVETYFALFAPEADVEDDGSEYHGTAEIRGWRTSVPDVRYDVLEMTDVRDGTVTARAAISGRLPGQPGRADVPVPTRHERTDPAPDDPPLKGASGTMNT